MPKETESSWLEPQRGTGRTGHTFPYRHPKGSWHLTGIHIYTHPNSIGYGLLTDDLKARFKRER